MRNIRGINTRLTQLDAMFHSKERQFPLVFFKYVFHLSVWFLYLCLVWKTCKIFYSCKLKNNVSYLPVSLIQRSRRNKSAEGFMFCCVAAAGFSVYQSKFYFFWLPSHLLKEYYILLITFPLICRISLYFIGCCVESAGKNVGSKKANWADAKNGESLSAI